MTERQSIDIIQLGTVAKFASKSESNVKLSWSGHKDLEVHSADNDYKEVTYVYDECFDEYVYEKDPDAPDKDVIAEPPLNISKPSIFQRARKWVGKKLECLIPGLKPQEKDASVAESQTWIDIDPQVIQEANTASADQLWTKIEEIEAENTNLRDDLEVHQAEHEDLMRQVMKTEEEFKKMQYEQAQGAELENELTNVMLEKIDIEEKSKTLKHWFTTQRARICKPKKVNAATQTDHGCPEEFKSRFAAYKQRLAKIKAKITSYTEKIGDMECEAEADLKVADAEIDVVNTEIADIEKQIKELMAAKKF